MTHAKGKFQPGEAYVAFSRIRILEKLHIISYTQSQIHVSEHVEKEMRRLRKIILSQMPSNLFHDVPGGVKLHLNIGNYKRKIEDMKDDDIFKNSGITLLNETHLGHGDTLASDMISTSKDVVLVHCNHNNRGGCVALTVNKKLNPKQISLEIVTVKKSEPIQMIVVSVYRPPPTPVC